MYKCLSGLISYLSNELPVIAYMPYTWLHPKDDAMHECIDCHNKNTIIQITLQFLVTHPCQSISLSVQRSSQLCPSGVNRLIVLCCVLYCIVLSHVLPHHLSDVWCRHWGNCTYTRALPVNCRRESQIVATIHHTYRSYLHLHHLWQSTEMHVHVYTLTTANVKYIDLLSTVSTVVCKYIHVHIETAHCDQSPNVVSISLIICACLFVHTATNIAVCLQNTHRQYLCAISDHEHSFLTCHFPCSTGFCPCLQCHV